MTSPLQSTNPNSLDDIFGSSPPYEESNIPIASDLSFTDSTAASHTTPALSTASTTTATITSNATTNPTTSKTVTTTVEPSELPSLRRQHVTAGYRDGISTSKGDHVQRGFDAGFPVGAQMGLRAGTVLGILEGLLRGYESRAGSAVVKKQLSSSSSPSSSSTAARTGTTSTEETEADLEMRRTKREAVLRLYRYAVKELNVQAVFAQGIEDGTRAGSGQGEDEEEKPESQLAKRGDLVLSKWEKRVCVARWEENMDVLEAKDETGV